MRIFTIAAATWREAIRQPVSIIVLCLAAAVTFLSQFVNFFPALFDDEAGFNFIRQTSVATTLICGIVIAVFSASAVLADEIENRTMVTLLAKPVRRYEVVLGKFFGLMMAIALAFFVMVTVSLATAWWTETPVEKWRANPALAVTELPAITTGQGTLQVSGSYAELLSKRNAQGHDYLHSAGDVLLWLTGQSSVLVARAPLAAPVEQPGTTERAESSPGLASLIGSVFDFAGPRTALHLKAFLLTFVQVMVIAAIAIALSTRLPLTLTALGCAAVFVLGNIGALLQKSLLEGPGENRLASLAAGACSLLPDLSLFDLNESLSLGATAVPPGVVTYGILYGILYAVMVLAVAVLLFQRREVT